MIFVIFKYHVQRIDHTSAFQLPIVIPQLHSGRYPQAELVYRQYRLALYHQSRYSMRFQSETHYLERPNFSREIQTNMVV